MQTLATAHRLTLALVMALAVGCSGGGGGGGPAPPDTVPNSFSFTAETDAAPGAMVQSASVTISGLGAAANISVTGGEYSIDGGAFTSAAGTIANQQSLTVRVAASAATNTATTLTVTIGGVSGSFTVTTLPDTTPDTPSFQDQINVAPSALVSSAAIIVTGIDIAVPITIMGGEYSINGGPFTNTAGTIAAQRALTVRVVASGSTNTSTAATVTIGGVSADFTVTTAPDTTPDNLSFQAQINVPRNAFIDSAAAIVAGIDVTVPISIAGGEYAIDGGPFTSAGGTIAAGQSLVLRVLSSSSHIVTVGAIVTVGSGSAQFDITTLPDTTPPSATVVFPPRQSRTGDDTVWVRGTATDVSTISSVLVDGVNATTSDGFATWTAAVPLSMGINDLVVETTDAANNSDAAAAQISVTRHIRFGLPASIELDSDDDRALVVDSAARALISVDLTTGDRTIVSDNGTPNANFAFLIAKDVVLDNPNGRAWVLDPSMQAVLSVDLTAGTRTVFSDLSNPFSSPVDMALDTANNRLLVLNSNPPSISAVDVTTGVRTVFSDATTPDGANLLSNPLAIDIDTANSRALVTNFIPNGVYAVDLTTGARTILSDDTTPNGINPLSFTPAIAVDAANSRALVIQSESDSVIAVDLTTGARSVFSSPTVPDTVNTFADPRSLTMDAANDRALVLDSEHRAILAVDLATGARSYVSRDEPANVNVTFSEPSDIMLDVANSRVLVTDHVRTAVIALDLDTAARTLFSTSFFKPGGIVPDLAANRAFVIDEGQPGIGPLGIFSVDLTTGTGTRVSDNTFPDANNPLQSPLALAIDTANARLLVSDWSAVGVIAVDISTGTRTIFSDNSTPDNVNSFVEVQGIVVDTNNNRALVANSTGSFASSLLGADLATGARTIFSNSTTPDPQNPFAIPLSLALDVGGNRVFLMDLANNQLLAVDLTTGGRTMISHNFSPYVPNPFATPAGMAYDPATKTLYVVNAGFAAVLAVDVTTGRRVYTLR